MTGRIVDSYTNISTVKLFSHSNREEATRKEAMDGFLRPSIGRCGCSSVLNIELTRSTSLLFVSVFGDRHLAVAAGAR